MFVIAQNGIVKTKSDVIRCSNAGKNVLKHACKSNTASLIKLKKLRII